MHTTTIFTKKVKLLLVSYLLFATFYVQAQALIVPSGPADLSSVEHLTKGQRFKVEVKKSSESAYQTCYLYETDNYAEGKKHASEIRDQKTVSFTNFSFSDTWVDVKITANFNVSNVIIRPLNYNITPVVNGNVITFTLKKPLKISVEVNDRLNPLFIFADKPDADPGAKGVTYYYGPGVHNIGLQKVIKSNETVYIAAGAVVEGTFKIPSGSSNIKFYGKGILSGGELPHLTSNTDTLLKYAPFTGSGLSNYVDHITWEDLMILNGAGWVFAAVSCFGAENHHLSWHNIKQVHWQGNTDVLWFDGHDNVADDCFFFANDDLTTHGSYDCKISNIVFWQGNAGGHIFMTSDYCSSRNIEYDNINIIGSEATVEIIRIWSGTGKTTSYDNIVFKNMRIEAHPYKNSYFTNKFITMNTNKNSVSNWLFENVTIDDQNADEGDFNGTLSGKIDGITFRNLKMKGNFITSLSEAKMSANAYATNIKFELAPDIELMQGNDYIVKGGFSDAFTSVASGDSKTVTYTIKNVGGTALNLTGTPKVKVEGDGYSLVSDAADIIASGASTIFQVKLDRTSSARFNGSITITSNDADEALFAYTVSNNGVTALNNVKGNKSGIEVFPNPANSNKLNINVMAISGEHITVEIFDLQGHTILLKKTVVGESGKIEIDISKVHAGTYFVKVVTQKGRTNVKTILIQK